MPARITRSSSRSRVPNVTPSSSAKKMESPAKSPAKSPSKSPARGRGRPPKKDSAVREAAKSATRIPAASRSRSRGRPRGSTTTTPASSSRKALKTPKEEPTEKKKKKTIESTIEVADDDEEDEVQIVSTPRQSRSVRNLTQEPPLTRTRVTRSSPIKTFPSEVKKTAPSQCSTLFECAKSKTVAGFNWIVALLTNVFLFIKSAVVAPFIYIYDIYNRLKHTGALRNPSVLLAIFLIIAIIIGKLFPALPIALRAYGEKHVYPQLRYVFSTFTKKTGEFEEFLKKHLWPKLELLGLKDRNIKA